MAEDPIIVPLYDTRGFYRDGYVDIEPHGETFVVVDVVDERHLLLRRPRRRELWVRRVGRLWRRLKHRLTAS